MRLAGAVNRNFPASTFEVQTCTWLTTSCQVFSRHQGISTGGQHRSTQSQSQFLEGFRPVTAEYLKVCNDPTRESPPAVQHEA